MAGKASRLEPLSFCLPKGLISINNQPSINLMISPLVKRGLKHAIFVTGPHNYSLVKAFVEKSYPNLHAQFVIQPSPDGPLDALRKATDYIHNPVLLLYGDTLCNTNFSTGKSFYGVYKQPKTNINISFGLIKTNAHKVITKVNHTSCKNEKTTNTIVGIYFFKNYQLLIDTLKKTYPDEVSEHSIYSAQQYYIEHEPTLARNFTDWQDSGNLNSFPEAVKMLSKTMCSPIKTSEKITCYATKTGGKATRNPDYLTLSEYYTFYPIRTDNFNTIFGLLITAKNAEFRALPPIPGQKNKNTVLSYFHRYFTNSLVKYDGLKVNSMPIMPHKTLAKLLRHYLSDLSITQNRYFGQLHGNLSFNNILYSPRTADFVFVNSGCPTVRLTRRRKQTGDTRWDAAALYASAHFDLGAITTDNFSVAYKTGKSLDYYIFPAPSLAVKELDRVLMDCGYDLAVLKSIACLYLIYMASLTISPEQKILLEAIALANLTSYFIGC